MTDPLLVADATNLAHRAWHAAGGNGTAETTAATVHRWITSAADRVTATTVIAAFDGPDAGAARYLLHPEYKAGRAAKDDHMRTALAAIPGLLADTGLPTIAPDQTEADDVLAAYAAQPGPTVLLTSDKDALGLLAHPDTRVLRPASGGVGNWTLLTAADLHTETGVHADHWALYAALKGDSSDNIPGLPGIGPGLAAKLAASLHTLEKFEHDLTTGATTTAATIGAARTSKLTTDLPATLALLHLSAQLAAPQPVPGLTPRDQIPPRTEQPGQRSIKAPNRPTSPATQRYIDSLF